MTIVVIAHRHSTISQADRIVVVEDGQIADEGDFDQLFGREGSCNNM
jgi:ABC-type bacteriocin/lantibiotic exporters, contain an N-terminal double-glycine peptidase domain